MLYLLAMDKFSASVLKSIFRLKFARESTCASVVIHTPGCKLQYITKDACFNVSYCFFFFFFVQCQMFCWLKSSCGRVIHYFKLLVVFLPLFCVFVLDGFFSSSFKQSFIHFVGCLLLYTSLCFYTDLLSCFVCFQARLSFICNQLRKRFVD